VPVDETHPLEPVDVNGIHKLAAEKYYALYHAVHGIRSVSLRLTNTYGPRMDLANDGKGFVGVFVRIALQGGLIRVFGDGSQRRDFDYVDDVVDALLLAGASARVDGGAFNLGHPRAYSLLEFVETLHRHASFTHRVVPFPPELRAIDIGDYVGDFSRFRELTGWTPRVDLDEGLARTLEHFRELGRRGPRRAA
jgi:nucleoside-diphosphate-sugar epimerase